MTFNRIYCVLTLSLALQSLSAPAAERIRVMFYNTYNLFDAEHDEGKNDWTYLPFSRSKFEGCKSKVKEKYRKICMETDWTPAKVKLKIAQLAKAIKLAAGEELPDLLGLSEVENSVVVKLLAEKLGYSKFVITDSPDDRGIDNALLYRESTQFTFDSSRELQIKVDQPTRNILEATFRSGRQKLLVYLNHWPSQSAPAKVRVKVAEQFMKWLRARLKKDPKANVLAMGDFNVIDADHPHPFKSVLEVGAENAARLYDVADLFEADKDIDDAIKDKMHLGTYFYVGGMVWNRLDRFFINKPLIKKSGMSVDVTSYRIKAPREIVRPFKYTNPRYSTKGSIIAGVPNRGNTSANDADKAGYSDHLPIYLEINLPD